MGHEKCPPCVTAWHSDQIVAHFVHHNMSLTEEATNHGEDSLSKLSFHLRGFFS